MLDLAQVAFLDSPVDKLTIWAPAGAQVLFDGPEPFGFGQSSHGLIMRRILDVRQRRRVECYGTYPGPRSTLPGSAPVILLPSITGTPLTSTNSMPSEN